MKIFFRQKEIFLSIGLKMRKFYEVRATRVIWELWEQ